MEELCLAKKNSKTRFFIYQFAELLNYLEMSKYLLNCFLLLIPVFVLNIVFINSLPQSYSANIQNTTNTLQSVFRIIIFILPLIMSISIEMKLQKFGLVLYIVGIVLYFISWIMQTHYPDSIWSQSVFGFLAPAYTPILWLVGIGLIGKVFFVRIPSFPIIYITLSLMFVLFHTLHIYGLCRRKSKNCQK